MKITMVGCWGAYPAVGEATSALLVEEKGFQMLIECGSGVLAQVQKYTSLASLDAVLVSHYHHDHVADLGPLQYALLIQEQLGKRNETLPIYGHQQDKEAYASLTYKSYTVGQPIEAGKSIRIGPWKASFCPTVHPAYCLAVKLEGNEKTLVYTADTEWCEALVPFAEEADFLITDCSLYDEQLGKVEGHLTAGQAGKLASLAQVKKLVLTHLPHYGDHQELTNQARRTFSGETVLAYSGLEIT